MIERERGIHLEFLSGYEPESGANREKERTKDTRSTTLSISMDYIPDDYNFRKNTTSFVLTDCVPDDYNLKKSTTSDSALMNYILDDYNFRKSTTSLCTTFPMSTTSGKAPHHLYRWAAFPMITTLRKAPHHLC